MSPVALGLDLLLAVLLVTAVIVGLKLNRKLKALRDSQTGFVKAVHELDAAAARAEAGLNALRAAQDQTHDSLLARIETARGLITRLEQATGRAAVIAAPAAAAIPSAPVAATPSTPQRPNFLSREAGPLRSQAPAFTREPPRPARAAAPPREIDDDLFEDRGHPPLRRDFRR